MLTNALISPDRDASPPRELDQSLRADKPPRFAIRSIELFERDMTFLHPFRFGDVTVTAAPQAFIRCCIAIEGIGDSIGASAEMMMPRWFDRRPERSPAETIDDLRTSLVAARAVYLASDEAETAFGHRVCAEAAPRPEGLTALAAGFGPALIDKAILDALFRGFGVGAREGFARNLPGLDARLTPDIDDAAIATFLASLAAPRSIGLRWTVGMLDAPDDLRREITASGLRYLKIKLGGDVARDIARLSEIAVSLAGEGGIEGITLDANEQYDPERLFRLVDALDDAPALAFIRRRLLYLEQPFPREATFTAALGALGERLPVIIDEGDDSFDAFLNAKALGYRGVSSKSCKGVYRALLNGVRARHWTAREPSGGPFFVAGEDLTCQAGLAVQQDTALAALLGLRHVERNGHHYVQGFGPAPAAEAAAMAAAHPDLYEAHDGGWRLAVRDGELTVGSLLTVPGFASGAMPVFTAMRRLESGADLAPDHTRSPDV